MRVLMVGDIVGKPGRSALLKESVNYEKRGALILLLQMVKMQHQVEDLP